MSVETTRLHGIIDRLRAIADELYDMDLIDAEYAVNDAVDVVREILNGIKNYND